MYGFTTDVSLVKLVGNARKIKDIFLKKGKIIFERYRTYC